MFMKKKISICQLKLSKNILATTLAIYQQTTIVFVFFIIIICIKKKVSVTKMKKNIFFLKHKDQALVLSIRIMV
jgi:hypothetical protein